MARYARNTAVLLALESAYGTDATPTGAAHALLVSNLSPTPLDAQNAERGNIRPFFGNNEELAGTRSVALAFDLEVAGSGALGTPPAWGPAVRACGFAQIITPGALVEYVPITNDPSSATIYWYDDGALHAMTGARGTFSIAAGVGNRPVFSFKMTGLYVPVTAASAPSVSFSAFRSPLVVTDQNSADVTLGGTYASGIVSGGTPVPSRGIDIDIGTRVSYTPLLGGDEVGITDRRPTCRLELDLTPAQLVARYAAIQDNATQSLSFAHGRVAGNIVQLWMPSVQLVNPGKADADGRRLESFDGRILPSAGNDDLIIAVR